VLKVSFDQVGLSCEGQSHILFGQSNQSNQSSQTHDQSGAAEITHTDSLTNKTSRTKIRHLFVSTYISHILLCFCFLS